MQINFEHMQKNLIEVVEYLESLEVLDATEIKNDVQIWGNDKSENNTKSKFKGLKKSSDFIPIALIFIIPKKNSTVHLILHFRFFKKCQVRKPYPVPKISSVLQKTEGLGWTASLDLYMGYKIVHLDLDS